MSRILLIAIIAILMPCYARASSPESSNAPTGANDSAVLGSELLETSRPDDESTDPTNSMLVRLDGSNQTEETFSDIQVGVAPEVLTSESPSLQQERVEGEADLAWLQGIEPPDIPVRWDDRVVNLLEYYRGNPQGRLHISTWFARLKRYGSMIRDKLREASIPDDLIYVAMVESGFDPTVKSDAGALGMWQFVEKTADEYGLERSRWVDQRMNPELSTDAAVRFLSDLYKRFGSWELSLAAFNMGYGALLRAIKKYNSNDFWLLSRIEAGLPYETVYYVTNVMACAIVGRNRDRFGISQDDSPQVNDQSFVTVPGGVGLGKLARAAGITTEELAALNPELLKSRIPPDVREWTLRIPANNRARFLQKLDRLKVETTSHDTYVVRFGEQLADVASMFETTTNALRRLNELDSDEQIGPGYQLLVPAVQPVQPQKNDASVIVAVPDQSFVYSDRRRVFYRVTGQDSIEEISRFFRVSDDDLRRWNSITKEASLQRGMVIQLFVPKEVDLTKTVVLTPDEVKVMVVGSDDFFDYHEAQRDRVRIRYRVRPGDTLAKIAERFELSVGSIARINRFSSQSTLRVDQEIIVYVPKENKKVEN
ncbi:MAG: transglycosylase SLT domain-containing protein [Deltaproteobacteria bacterium]|nr:transglycosylase SLT domain-containing protein [Deltaproteobacteria bacterium]